MRYAHRWRELGSNRLLLVLAVNFLLALAAFLLGIYVLNVQAARRMVEITDAYVTRVILLCFCLYALVCGVIDYFTIIKPINELEEQLEQYKEIAAEAGNRVVLDRLDHLTVRSAFAYLNQQQQAVVRRNRSMEVRQMTTELHALQSQINPHFLYNALDSIRGLAYYHGIDEIAELTEALSRLFRNMISREGKMLTLRQEIENINNYVKIQLFRFSHNFTYSCDIQPAILDRYKILNMTLQPIVENAIMHGLERQIGMGSVRISGYVTERRMILSVTDNGAGISAEKVAELNQGFNMGANISAGGDSRHHAGIGLMTINRRIKLQFGDNYGLSIASTPGVNTTVEIVLPLIANVN